MPWNPPQLVARAGVLALLAALLALSPARAQESGVAVEVLGRGVVAFTDVVGGPTEVVTARITIAPGSGTGWHQHAGPLYGIVTAGELTIHDDHNCRLSYPTGSVRVEVPDDVHEGLNEGTVPVTLVATYVVPAGAELSYPAPAPTVVCEE